MGSSLGDTRMDVNLLNQQLVNLVTSMFQEGFLDEQFTQLQMLQDARNPGFVADVISLFSVDSERLLAELTKTLEQYPADFKKVDAYVHQFKGSSSSIGAYRVKIACMDFHSFCEGHNREGCLLALQQLKQEFYLVKTKLDVMLQMEQKLLAAGGVIPME
ncbi:hypothetical protein SUGI_0498210 [Cryptomeria japonica]|uniref:histidine-containing phosphotransfer protein 1 n=1 Tax=Cryptomeria japonica TaxID=3369 RepID=UPI002408E033|nr:histidine-containing phosphotransfer protein 1 [Cryptomeria japonica]GLJ25979.1 hypothetical protein SUGI_0498210 [Cryptomeria japonica]